MPMPALDTCEPQIIRALEKAGWIVTHQPFAIRVAKDEGVFADVRLQHADHANVIIVVEIKCFSEKRSLLDTFYHAVGQYLVYRNALMLKHMEADLYLTVPKTVFEDFFQRLSVQSVVKDAKIKLIVIDFEREEITQWNP
jgi:hypothetical protein